MFMENLWRKRQDFFTFKYVNKILRLMENLSQS